ncbi:MAG: hypothetical protein MI785_12635 [Kiloniellales bacterium]|nr:hypothetical protein [Kiloniellales bacterium]
MDAAGFAFGKDPGIKSGHDSGVGGSDRGMADAMKVRIKPALRPWPGSCHFLAVITGLDPVIHGR